MRWTIIQLELISRPLDPASKRTLFPMEMLTNRKPLKYLLFNPRRSKGTAKLLFFSLAPINIRFI